MQDYGFMICRSFEDPDGHIWEVVCMDPSFMQPTCSYFQTQKKRETP